MADIKERLGPQILFDFADIIEAIAFVRKNGFNVLEINLSNIYFNNQIKEKSLRERIRQEVDRGMKILFHHPEGISFFVLEEEMLLLSLSLLKRTLDYLNEMGAERLTIHLGTDFTFGITGKKVLTCEIYPDFFTARIEEVIKAMRSLSSGKTILCIENVGGFRYPFVMEILSRHLGSKAASSGIGLTLDIGHIHRLPAEKQRIEEDFFKRHLNHIKNCHIHDNSGEWDEHNIVGEGKVDIRSYIEMLRETESYLIAEVRPKESALESLRRLEEML